MFGAGSEPGETPDFLFFAPRFGHWNKLPFARTPTRVLRTWLRWLEMHPPAAPPPWLPIIAEGKHSYDLEYQLPTEAS